MPAIQIIFSLLIGIGDSIIRVRDALVGFGWVGVFAIALLDSALIPMPGGPDAVVMFFSHRSPAWMPIFAAAAALGSTFGSLFLYAIARRSGDVALRKFSEVKQEKVQRALEQYGLWALMVASVLPPPFPFKLFVLSAGAFRMPVWQFITALLISRGLRFTLEGLAAVRYGEQAAELLKQHYPMIGFSVALLIMLALLVRHLSKRKHSAADR
jgi:membrane protein YqaA with SNARE-associated domain